MTDCPEHPGTRLIDGSCTNCAWHDQPSPLRGTDAAREAIRQARGDEAVPQIPILFAHPDGQEPDCCEACARSPRQQAAHARLAAHEAKSAVSAEGAQR